MPASPLGEAGTSAVCGASTTGASPGTVRAARVAGVVGTAVRAEDVLSGRGLRCSPGYWGVPAVVCRRTQSWVPMYVLDGAVVPVGRSLFSKQPMDCIVDHKGVDVNV